MSLLLRRDLLSASLLLDEENETFQFEVCVGDQLAVIEGDFDVLPLPHSQLSRSILSTVIPEGVFFYGMFAGSLMVSHQGSTVSARSRNCDGVTSFIEICECGPVDHEISHEVGGATATFIVTPKWYQ